MRDFGEAVPDRDGTELPGVEGIARAKAILELPCQKAGFTNAEGVDVVVWFTPSISSPIGPGDFYGLPGAILMVDVDNGRRIYESAGRHYGWAPEFEAPPKAKRSARTT